MTTFYIHLGENTWNFPQIVFAGVTDAFSLIKFSSYKEALKMPDVKYIILLNIIKEYWTPSSYGNYHVRYNCKIFDRNENEIILEKNGMKCFQLIYHASTASYPFNKTGFQYYLMDNMGVIKDMFLGDNYQDLAPLLDLFKEFETVTNWAEYDEKKELEKKELAEKRRIEKENSEKAIAEKKEKVRKLLENVNEILINIASSSNLKIEEVFELQKEAFERVQNATKDK